MKIFFCHTYALMAKQPKFFFGHFNSRIQQLLFTGGERSKFSKLGEWEENEGKIKVRLSQDIPGFILQTLKQHLDKDETNF